eukprot:767218-Hanusia_phi.AAC.1
MGMRMGMGMWRRKRRRRRMRRRRRRRRRRKGWWWCGRRRRRRYDKKEQEVLKLKETDTSLIQNLSAKTHELERKYERVLTERDEMEQELLELQRQQAKLERKRYAETIKDMQAEINDLHVAAEIQRVEMAQQLASLQQEAAL